MKVKIEVTVKVDDEVWASEYGLAPSDKESLRQDIKNYYANYVFDSPPYQEGYVEVVRFRKCPDG